tara:strand:- start:1465 stop:2217 length:753 start_codon:yes stop_codon:yes gene_type:complete
MLKRMPPHKRRRKSKARISVALTNQNRVTVRDGKLTITKANATGKSTIRDDAPGFADASECLADSVVMLPLGKQTVTVRHSLKQCRALARLARKYGIRLLPMCGNANGIVTDVTGHTEDVIEFCNHVAGHSDLSGSEITLSESAIESTGTDGHKDRVPSELDEYKTSEADRVRHRPPQSFYTAGSDVSPKRIDYTAGRNQPKASYPINGLRPVNELDHSDSRDQPFNAKPSDEPVKVRRLKTPQLAHTEH